MEMGIHLRLLYVFFFVILDGVAARYSHFVSLERRGRSQLESFCILETKKKNIQFKADSERERGKEATFSIIMPTLYVVRRRSGGESSFSSEEETTGSTNQG